MVAEKNGIEQMEGLETPPNLHKGLNGKVLLEAVKTGFEGGHFSAANAALKQLVKCCEKLDPSLRNQLTKELVVIRDRALRRQSEEMDMPYIHKADLDQLVESLTTAIEEIPSMPTAPLEVARQEQNTWRRVMHFLLNL